MAPAATPSEAERLSALAAQQPSAPTGPPPSPEDFGPQAQAQAPGPGDAQAQQAQQAQGTDEGQVRQTVGKMLQEMMDLGGQIAQVDPRTTTIVKANLEKLYLQLADFYGLGEDAKLALKKGRAQVQGQGLNTMSQMGQQ